VDKSPADTNYQCFRTEDWNLLNHFAVPPPHPTQCPKLGEIAGTSFQPCVSGVGKVKHVKLSRIWRVRKSTKSAKFKTFVRGGRWDPLAREIFSSSFFVWLQLVHLLEQTRLWLTGHELRYQWRQEGKFILISILIFLSKLTENC